MAFAAERDDPPAIEVRVNFGVYAGREATLAEIEIISEERHLIDSNVEASIHQVRIEVSADRAPTDPQERSEVEQRIVERADYWARQCVADRHLEITDDV